MMAALVLMTVLAQAPGAPPGKEQAQFLLDDGLALYERQDYAAALVKFNQALAAFPSPKLWFNVAQTQRDLNHPVEALGAFEKFLATADGPPDALASARRSVTELQRKLGRLHLRDAESGIEVSIDGRIVGRTPFVNDVWVNPGSHVLVIGTAAASASTTVTVAAGSSETVILPSLPTRASPLGGTTPVHPAAVDAVKAPVAAMTDTQPASLPPVADIHRGWWLGRTWTWVAAGAAVASAAGALTFGFLMQSKYDDLNHSCGSLSTSRSGCSASDLKSLDQRKTAANILWIAAGASAVTASILFALESQPVVVGPVGGQPLGLIVRGKF